MLQEDVNHPAGEEVGEGEERFAEVEVEATPCCWVEEPGEKGRIAVGGAGVGGLAPGDVARGIGEDKVVDVGVLEWGVRVLIYAPDKEREAKEDSQSEDFAWGGEDGG